MYSFTHSKNGPKKLSQAYVDIIANDLNNAFSMKARLNHLQLSNGQIVIKTRSIKPSDIQDVYVFTWLGMAHKIDVRKLVDNMVKYSTIY